MKYLIAILSVILSAGCGQKPDRPAGRYTVSCPGISSAIHVRVLPDGRTVDRNDSDKIVQIPNSGDCVWKQR